MKVSIVMAYFNRRAQFIRTLNSINESIHKDIELIVVDDCSQDDQRLDDLCDQYTFIKLLRIEKSVKSWVNPCKTYNIGISQATGDIVIIQNPECVHTRDIIKYVVDNVNESNYLSFSCYALTKQKTEELNNILYKDFYSYIYALPQKNFLEIGWYNHSYFRPVAYHFCSAITRKNIIRLGGFDERFADGLCYDDNELVERVKRAGLKITIVDSHPVIHQYHDKKEHFSMKNYKSLLIKNKTLFETVVLKETKICANV